MREEISSIAKDLEERRIENMRCWYESEEFKTEYAESEKLFQAYRKMKKTLKRDVVELLDQMEEELFILKEAELQAAYMQGISDGMDMMDDQKRYQSVS